MLGVVFSREETQVFTAHLDEDKSGDVDEEEFQDKISLDNLHRESHKFLISEVSFVEKILAEWYHHQSAELEKIRQGILDFDDNGDGIMQLEEFE